MQQSPARAANLTWLAMAEEGAIRPRTIHPHGWRAYVREQGSSAWLRTLTWLGMAEEGAKPSAAPSHRR
jgi:hypothetical protein